MFGNLRLQCRQYVGNIRRCREMVRLLLHFCYAIRVSFFISFYQKNPLLHKKITVGEYLQKRRQALSSIVTIVLSFGTQKMAKEHSSCN